MLGEDYIGGGYLGDPADGEFIAGNQRVVLMDPLARSVDVEVNRSVAAAPLLRSVDMAPARSVTAGPLLRSVEVTA